jgi:D-inositol-3-phosphate glycosyltransferase
LRIAFFSPHSDPLAAPGEPNSGGQCVYEKMIAKTLAAWGHTVRIYTRLWGNKKRFEQICPGAIVHRYQMGHKGFLSKEEMSPYIYDFTRAILSHERVWLRSIDVLHGHYWDGGLSAGQVSNLLGKPLLFTSHSLGVLKQDKRLNISLGGSTFYYSDRIKSESYVIRSAQAVIALSQFEKQVLIDRYGARPSKILVIPGGVDTQQFHPPDNRGQLKQQLGIAADLLVFTAGRLDRRKGFLELVDSLPYVIDGVERMGKRVTFMLPTCTKEASPYECRYHQQIVDRVVHHGIENYIHWIPWIGDELATYYGAADVFVCPSLYEPFGLVVLEALATGTPVVATHKGGPREIIRNGVNGFIADPLDRQTFAQRILQVLLAPEDTRIRMSSAARKVCVTNYSWPKISKKIEDIYNELVKKETTLNQPGSERARRCQSSFSD